jgi:hypothetical protein
MFSHPNGKPQEQLQRAQQQSAQQKGNPQLHSAMQQLPSQVEFQLPPQFICPFTCKIMTSPVMSIACGHHFECSAIRRLFSEENSAEQPCCPIDNTPLDASRIIPAHELQAVIQQWPHIQQYMEAEQHQNGQLTNAPVARPNVTATPPTQSAHPPLTLANLSAAAAAASGAPLAIHNGAPDVSALWDDPVALAHMRSKLTAGGSEKEMDAAEEATQQQMANDDKTGDPRKYKTRLCRNWVQTGQCAYEDVCCFAHGDSELRDPAANLKVLSDLGYFLDTPDPRKVATPPSAVPGPSRPQAVGNLPGVTFGANRITRPAKPGAAPSPQVPGRVGLPMGITRPGGVGAGPEYGMDSIPRLDLGQDAMPHFTLSQNGISQNSNSGMHYQTISLTMEQLARLGLTNINMTNMGDVQHAFVPQQQVPPQRYPTAPDMHYNSAAARGNRVHATADPAVLMWQPLK